LRRRSVVFAPEARGDLLELADWIAERAGAEAALAYIARLEAYYMGFEVGGERGHRRDDIRPGLRITGFERRITIAFVTSETEVLILRLYYGGRNRLAPSAS
jgi:toxin ParE1/3/4